MSDDTAASDSVAPGQDANAVDVGEDGNSATQTDGQETAQLPEQSTQPEAETTHDGPTTSGGTAEERALESRWEMLVRRVLTKYWLEALVAVIALCISCALALFLCSIYFPVIQPNCTLGFVGQWNQWSLCKCGDLNRTRKREVEVFDGDCVLNSEMQPCPTSACNQCVMGECFGFDNRQMSWSQALREDNLASIHSHNQMMHLWARVEQSTPKLWIGLRCFTHGTCEWSDRSDVDYWAIDGNQTLNETVLCTYIDLNDKKWHFGSCYDRLASVKNLWMDKKNNCSSYLDQCYAISEDQQQWEKANDLVIIENPQENSFVKSLLDSKNATYWIGLRCSDGQRCMWWDKSGVKYINGSLDSYAGSYCVLMDAEGGWEGRDCTETHPYISESQPHCNKIGKRYWSPWSECYCGEERKRSRGPHSLCSEPIPEQSETQECNKQLCAHCDEKEKFDWCYQLSDNTKSYKNIEGDLVTIGSKQENDFIMKLLRETQVTSRVLIGLGCESTQQLSYCQWYSGEHLKYNKFGLDQPLVRNQSYTCVAIDVQRDEWMSVDCRDELRYVLEHKPVCDKFVNYSNIVYGSSECTHGLINYDIESPKNCPLVLEKKSDVCQEDCAPHYEVLEYCYKVMFEKKRPDALDSEHMLAVIADERHTRFINEQVVPRAINSDTASELKLWLGIYCDGEDMCYWRHNKVQFVPTTLSLPLDVTIRTKDTHCGMLNWTSDTDRSIVEIHDCLAELPYILEWAPGCDKFRRFESLEYICDEPGCGNTICVPEDATNCPHQLNFTEPCCSGETREGLSACYQVERETESNSAWQFYQELKDTKSNLADPFYPQVTEFWKGIVPKRSGFYLTSYHCEITWYSWGQGGRGNLNLVSCTRFEDRLPYEVAARARNELKDSWDKQSARTCPPETEGGRETPLDSGRGATCHVDVLVVYNSDTERMELLEDRSKPVTSYIVQYAKENKEFSTHFCPSYSQNSDIQKHELVCPVHGRCCSGQTAEFVPACYQVIKQSNTTYNNLKASSKNVADLGINEVKEGGQLAIVTAVIKLWRQMIDKNSGRYWTNLKCKLMEEGTAADCRNHFQQETQTLRPTSYKNQTSTITFDPNCKDCCLVYDSELQDYHAAYDKGYCVASARGIAVVRTQECDSVEEISGYIAQYPKYARVNDWIGVSYCYDRLTWTKGQEFNTKTHYDQATPFCPPQQHRCNPLLKLYASSTPTILLYN